jgi:phytol kinase
MWDSANLRDLSARDLNTSDSQTRGSRLSLSFIPTWLRSELVRKSLHMLIAFVPSIAATAGMPTALALLSFGTLVFAVAEYLRLNGHHVAIITRLTVVASRGRDQDRFVLGPVTLAVGAMLALLLYPSTAAALAIYALAFGDGIASLFGRAFGQTKIIAGKTVEGSLACFAAVWFVTLLVTGRIEIAMAIAVVATVLEALPTDDMDNIILPAGVGLVATLLLHL